MESKVCGQGVPQRVKGAPALGALVKPLRREGRPVSFSEKKMD